MKKKDFKNFEVEIRTTIVYPTWCHVELFDFEQGIYEIIEEIFEDAEIEIKKDKKGISYLEILSIKEAKQRKQRAHKNT